MPSLQLTSKRVLSNAHLIYPYLFNVISSALSPSSFFPITLKLQSVWWPRLENTGLADAEQWQTNHIVKGIKIASHTIVWQLFQECWSFGVMSLPMENQPYNFSTSLWSSPQTQTGEIDSIAPPAGYIRLLHPRLLTIYINDNFNIIIKYTILQIKLNPIVHT